MTAEGAPCGRASIIPQKNDVFFRDSIPERSLAVMAAAQSCGAASQIHSGASPSSWMIRSRCHPRPRPMAVTPVSNRMPHDPRNLSARALSSLSGERLVSLAARGLVSDSTWPSGPTPEPTVSPTATSSGRTRPLNVARAVPRAPGSIWLPGPVWLPGPLALSGLRRHPVLSELSGLLGLPGAPVLTAV
ncbi:MAG: hypothetical protein LBT40_09015 [Deltaproteobacteria bacterium]|nr:hypothetical protein [Deltaproteobacteria bacterium]